MMLYYNTHMKRYLPILRGLIKRRNARLRKLPSLSPFVAASLVTIRRRCGQPNCHCASGEGHPATILSFKEDGKPRTAYVPVDKIEEVKQWVENYKELKELIKEISLLNIQILRLHVKLKREKRRR